MIDDAHADRPASTVTPAADGPAHRSRPSAADAGSTDDWDGLARRLASLARELQREPSSQEVMDRVVAAAVAMVPGAIEGTISLVSGRRRAAAAAATTDHARRFDELQTEVGQGPCLDAVFEHQTTRVEELSEETTRWPQLAERAEAAGYSSVLCFQLFVEGDNLGALNLLGDHPGAFDDESEHVGLLFASHAAIAVADAQRLETLHRGLANRDVIGQAKGILMERFKITPDQAFELLARVSQDTNRKLHEVASELTRTGVLRGD